MSAYGEKRKKWQWLTLIILQPASHFTTTITIHITIRVFFISIFQLHFFDSNHILNWNISTAFIREIFTFFNDFFNFKKLKFFFFLLNNWRLFLQTVLRELKRVPTLIELAKHNDRTPRSLGNDWSTQRRQRIKLCNINKEMWARENLESTKKCWEREKMLKSLSAVLHIVANIIIKRIFSKIIKLQK